MKIVCTLFVIASLIGFSGCDSVQPTREGVLVLDAFVDSGKPLPPVRVRRTQSTSTPLSDNFGAVVDAEVTFILDGTSFRYEPAPATPGLYLPTPADSSTRVPALSDFVVRVRSGSDSAVASGRVPPRIRIENIFIDIPDRAVDAILTDTLDLGLDSLDLGLNAQTGYIYPVQVSIDWDRIPNNAGSDDAYWVETSLNPVTKFSSSIIDFFLLPDQVIPESAVPPVTISISRWQGIYAVPVDAMDAPIPVHELTVTIVRGDADFASFTSSRRNPDQREPVSNVSGGIGFVGGVSIDSTRIVVSPILQ